MQKIFIIDASGYLYSAYFAIRNMTNSKGESTNALYGFIRSVLKLIKDFQPTHIVSVFDGPHNGKKREEIYPDYKAHRSAAPQDLPYQIAWAQAFCTLQGIPWLNIPEVEADDTMGSIATWVSNRAGASAYLCTSDKDMCQLVKDHIFMLNTRKDNLVIGPQQVEEIHGVLPDQMIDFLAMTGDASDNVPGLPGIGPKTAAALLKQFGSLDNLLANSADVVGDKKRAAIIENADKARLSRQLVTIDLAVPIPHDENFYRLKQPDISQLKQFYSSMNFNSLIKELDLSTQAQSIHTHSASQQLSLFPEEAPPVDNYQLVDDEQSLQALIAMLQTKKEICFDTETTNVRPLKAELVGIGFALEPHNAWYVPANGALGLNRVLEAFKPLFENQALGFYGHNVKYDYHVLANYGIHVANICFDTLLASYVLNSHHRQHSLDTLVLQYFGQAMTDISELIGKGKKAITMLDVPIDKVCTYCCADADYTCRLKAVLEKGLHERKLGKIFFDIELPLLTVLAGMERRGIFVDVPCLKKMSHEIQHKIQLIAQEIYQLAGEEFNLNSPKQLSHILQDKLHIPLPKKTATGFSTNADILDALKNKYPIAGIILDYRSLEKLRSTYIENLPDDVLPQTQRIHCTFNQSVAATGRLSCQDPNLQNIPVRTEEGRKIRQAFRPQLPGWSYLAADYSQVELRLLAHLSQDPNLLHAFNHNEDIHRFTAATMFNIPLAEVTKEQRQQAKAVNFGIIYGQQAFGLSQELKIDIKDAAAFIDMYFKRYPHVRDFLEDCKNQARKTGKAVTFTGRERAIPEISSKNGQLRQLAERLAVNTPVQGAAADMIKLAMLKIDEKLSQQHLKGYMILQIHDELIFEIPDEEIEIFKPLVKEAMQGVFQLKIPLTVDIAIGKNWKEC